MVDPASIDINSLPSVYLNQLNSLPDRPGVYFAIDEEEKVYYVGRAVSLINRWKYHHRFRQLSEIGSIKLHYLLVERPDELPYLEEKFINLLSPVLNGKPTIESLERRERAAQSISSPEGLFKIIGSSRRKLFCRLPNLMVEKNPRLTQRALSAELGLSHTTVNKLYNGRPLTARVDPNVLDLICAYFNCDVGDLLVMKEVGETNA
jgi:putative transcriptional regulator